MWSCDRSEGQQGGTVVHMKDARLFDESTLSSVEESEPFSSPTQRPYRVVPQSHLCNL